MAPIAAPTPDDRLVFLDWLRIIAFTLLVPYHVGMYYVSWPWHVKSVHVVTALEPWMRLSSPWRMSLLFVVSGAALSLSLRRHAVDGAWMAARARRLLMPLAAGMALIVPLQPYFEVRQFHGYAGGFADFLALYFTASGDFCSAARGCLVLPTWNHLWYLPYLLVYTLVLGAALRRWPALLDEAAARLSPHLGHVAGLVIPAAWLLGTMIWLRPHFPPTHALVDDVYLHAQYAPLFLLGAVLARLPAAWRRAESLRWPALALALAAWLLWVAGPGTGGWAGLKAAACVSVMQWCAVVAALGFGVRHLTADGPGRRRLAEAVFPLYLLHQSAIIALAMALAPLGLGPLIEAPLLVAFGFAAGALGYLLAREVRWLKPWLGLPVGARPPRRQSLAPGPASS